MPPPEVSPGLDIRPPAVAGRFYPSEPNTLRAVVRECAVGFSEANQDATGVMVPHAGIRFSGTCAASVLTPLKTPRTCVILSPNHTGQFPWNAAASVSSCHGFATPLGIVPIDRARTRAIVEQCDACVFDNDAHEHEHGIEVILPFLQVLYDPVPAIVPIIVHEDSWETCRAIAEVLSTLLPSDNSVLIIASSDMNHFESADVAERKDQRALAEAERLDGAALLSVCQRENITMCGRAPAAIMLECCRIKGATTATVIDYRHSGWVMGDDTNVVSYASMVVL